MRRILHQWAIGLVACWDVSLDGGGLMQDMAKGRRKRAEGRRFITATWSFGPLKQVLTFMVTAITAR
ncbi:MAG TPA: hypothetical protein V6C85_26225 [Allocoleopsis sp.]